MYVQQQSLAIHITRTLIFKKAFATQVKLIFIRFQKIVVDNCLYFSFDFSWMIAAISCQMGFN